MALGLEFFEDDLDALVELLVLAAEFAGGVVVDEDVGFDPFALDDPRFSIDRVFAFRRNSEIAAIGKRERTVDADDAAPRAFADEFAQTGGAETVGKDVTVGGRVFGDQCYFGAEQLVVGGGAGCCG